jgi:hypothetical protein
LFQTATLQGENLKRNVARLRADNQVLKEQLGGKEDVEKLMPAEQL